MIILEKFFHSSIGKKIIVALTGLGMALFLLGHMSGNLLMFVGPDAVNEYAQGLKRLLRIGEFPAFLWLARAGLLTFIIAHVTLTLLLAYENKKARPQRYHYQNTVQAGFASRTMILTGLVVLFFLTYHLLHFTLGEVHSRYFDIRDHLGRPNVYEMVVRSFRHTTELFGARLPFIALTYLGGLAVLAAHLLHGIASLFQTLSLVRGSASYAVLRKISYAFVVVVIGGFLSVPISILLGIIKLPGE